MGNLIEHRTRGGIVVHIDLSDGQGDLPQLARITIPGLNPDIYFDVVRGPWLDTEEAIVAAKIAAEAWIELNYD